ncbi:hypothetical protein [Pseudoalteromonas sp. NSLLW218]|uniref:hypothetical protein n=1 Tax=Pseudoalteromonas sp. NSLLW218 TaxID=2792048 RepID=UPI0018CD708C|nr:hypothetical protein [Pseudoalteromonas sp. NSLLW218]MBH0088146.1 hypothetical protein [Pseudoalteromonas sp. NSLLW218]
MHLSVLKPLTIIAICLTSFAVSAAPYTPKDDAVIASSNSTFSASLSVHEINTLVTNSQYAGQTERLQGLLKTRLAQLYNQTPTSQIGYLYARVLQKEHLFDEAINVANNVLITEPKHSNSHLLLANILMTQGEFTKAKQHCVALIGQVSTITASTCVLDVQSQHESVLDSYQTLVKIINNNQTSLATNHVLSEMSYRLSNYKQALSHLQSVDLVQAPVSLIVLWADIQIALNQPQQVLNTLSVLLPDKSNLEDAILLRLSIAEKKLNKRDKKWQNTMAKRVTLRELRKDSFHASDLAKYYLDVQPNREKALYWAHINWQQAKMSTDEQLLIKAKAMQRDTL